MGRPGHHDQAVSNTSLTEAEARVPPASAFSKNADANFRLRVFAVWGTLFALFVFFFLSFNLKFEFILQKFPYLAGFTLTRDGFLQGAALTLFVCFFAIIASIILGLI